MRGKAKFARFDSGSHLGVITGLDPAIHLSARAKKMDCQVKPGNGQTEYDGLSPIPPGKWAAQPRSGSGSRYSGARSRFFATCSNS